MQPERYGSKIPKWKRFILIILIDANGAAVAKLTSSRVASSLGKRGTSQTYQAAYGSVVVGLIGLK